MGGNERNIDNILQSLGPQVQKVVDINQPDGTKIQLPLDVAAVQIGLWLRDELRGIRDALESIVETRSMTPDNVSPLSTRQLIEGGDNDRSTSGDPLEGS